MLPETMNAMVFEGSGRPLRLQQIPMPVPGPEEVLIQVHVCGVCHTDLHIIKGELEHPKLPLVPGHQITGIVAAIGEKVTHFTPGERIGVPWLGHTDGTCRYCLRGQENLCDHPIFTGYTKDGGFAEYAVADQRYCFSISDIYTFEEAAPLLCAGLIGYRTYRLAGEDINNLGIYGFGAAAHIVAQIAVHRGQKVYAFTRPGDVQAQEFALHLGAAWAGGSTEKPPVPLDAALIFAPVGTLIVEALKATAKGGAIVCGGIHMSDIPSFPYHLLWEERLVRSVANLTRQDGIEFLSLAPQIPVRTAIEIHPLEHANEVLENLSNGKIQGAAVLRVRPG